MPYETLTITIDGTEPRVSKDRIATLVTGWKDGFLQWDSEQSTGFIDAVTYTAFLRPNEPWEGCLLKANYLLTSAKWVEHNYGENGRVYLYGVDAGGELVQTSQVWEKNQGFWVSYFAFGTNEATEQLRFVLGDVGLKFYADGSVTVHKPVSGPSDIGDSNLVGDGSITDLPEDFFLAAQERTAADNLNGAPVDVFLLPCRQRELLVLSNRGGGFSWTFDDVDQDDPDPTITASGRVQWTVPEGQAMVLVSPYSPPTSGEVVSNVLEFREAPASGATPTTRAYWDGPGSATCTLLNAAGTGAFVADGTETQHRLKVAMTGDGHFSPFVYGADAVFPAITTETDDSEAYNLNSYTIEASLEVPDTPNDVHFSFRLKDIENVESNVAAVKRIANRPLRVDIGTGLTFFGRTGSPHWEDSTAAELRTARFECRDPWKSLERYQILDPTPYDGFALHDAISELAQMSGVPGSAMDIETFAYDLPETGQASKGEWAVIPEAGEKAGEMLDRLWTDYARNVWYGFVPTADGLKFRFRSPLDLGTTPVATLYATREAAITALITAGATAEEAEADAYLYTFEAFDEDTLEIEANILRVSGWDRRTRRAFQSVWQDDDSLDPTLAPSARPENWYGEPLRVSYFDPAYVSLDDTNYVLGVLRQRLTVSPIVAQWSCQFLRKADGAPVWRGDVVTLDGKGDYRVRTLSARFEVESPSRIWRPTTYVGEKIVG